MHEIERAAFGKIVGNDVVPAKREVWVRQPFEESHFQVGRQDMATVSDTLAQPRRDRTGASANLPATPSRANPECLQVTDRSRVECLLQGGQPRPLLVPRLVEWVVAHRRSSFTAKPAGGVP